MKRVATAAVLLPLVLLLIFFSRVPTWLITLFAVLVAELALWEYLTLADAAGAKTPRIVDHARSRAPLCLHFPPPGFPGTRSWERSH